MTLVSVLSQQFFPLTAVLCHMAGQLHARLVTLLHLFHSYQRQALWLIKLSFEQFKRYFPFPFKLAFATFKNHCKTYGLETAILLCSGFCHADTVELACLCCTMSGAVSAHTSDDLSVTTPAENLSIWSFYFFNFTFLQKE